MNLLTEQWIPVRTLDGSRQWVRPDQLSDERIVAFDASRADFNGALAQFVIGLLQTTSPVDSNVGWRKLLKTPPDQAALQKWFAAHSDAFEFDGNGARFMQDFDLRVVEGEAIGIGGLFIESPGENTIKNNSDHFIKRGQMDHLCPHCAALALFTLQVNAPSGGAGHRTGLRGGGPLTTLLVASSTPESPRSLWHSLWLNVQERGKFDAGSGDAEKLDMGFTYPWTNSIQHIQKEGGQVAPIQVHASHIFWAMPRRIRLDLDNVSEGLCELCGRTSDRLIHQYVTQNHGLDYKGAWRHPFTPYYQLKDDMLPMHPQPGGIGYRHWMGLVLGVPNEKRKVERAAVVERFFQDEVERRAGVELRLWAFGFDMNNMKSRCWYESTMPLYGLTDCSPQALESLREDVGVCLEGAELVAEYLRNAVKNAWFARDAKGDFSFVDTSFWSRTEQDFYVLLKARIEAAKVGDFQDGVAFGERWLSTLFRAAKKLFDTDLVGAGPIERQNPARIAAAHNQLIGCLGGPKLRKTLKLPDAVKPAKKIKPVAIKAK